MLDLSPQTQEILEAHEADQLTFNQLFCSAVLQGESAVGYALGSSFSRRFDSASELLNHQRELLHAWMQDQKVEIDFHGHDDTDSEMFDAFLLGRVIGFNWNRHKERAGRIINNQRNNLSYIFASFPPERSFADFARSVTNDSPEKPFPQGWVKNLWHQPAQAKEQMGDSDTPRLLLDVDGSVFFPIRGDVSTIGIRPGIVEFLAQIQEAGYRVGFFTDAAMSSIVRRTQGIARNDRPYHTCVTWDKSGAKHVLSRTEAEEIFQALQSVDFAITRYATHGFHPHGTIATDPLLFSQPEHNHFHRQMYLRYTQSIGCLPVSSLKVIPPEIGGRNVILDDRAADIHILYRDLDFATTSPATLIQSPVTMHRGELCYRFTHSNLDDLAPRILESNARTIDELHRMADTQSVSYTYIPAT